MSTIIRSEVMALVGTARKLFMTPDIFRSLASHITVIQPGFDLLRSYHYASVDDLIVWLVVMSRINYLQEASTNTQLPTQLSAVYSDVFDKLSADMFNNPHPSRWNGSHREMLGTRSLDVDNVIMDPPQMPPPSTPTPNFKKYAEPLALRRLEAETEVFRTENTLGSLGGGRGHDGDRSFSTDGAFNMGESDKVEAWAEGQVETIEEIEVECTLNLTRQRPGTSTMTKVIWLMCTQANLRVKLSRDASLQHRLRPTHTFVLCLKNLPRLT